MASELRKPNVSDENVEAINDTAVAPINAVAKEKLLRECDLYVLPPLSVLFLLALRDRTNIGNASIQGLEADLNMHNNDYNIALFIFFIPYTLFKVVKQQLCPLRQASQKGSNTRLL